MIHITAWIVLMILAPCLNAVSQPVTTGSLVKEMADLEHLVEYPEPYYQNIQYSSYDRRSDQPGGKGWYANNDGFGGEPIPNFQAVLEKPGEDGVGTYLICDVEGPGAMVRGWTARLGGTLRVYLDGAKTPVYEGPSETFLQKTYDPFLKQAEFDSTILEGTFTQRSAGYYPIPFADRLRIEWTGNIEKLHFYEVQIRKYKKGTEVQTFQPQDLDTYSKEIKNTARFLKNPGKLISSPDQQQIKKFSAKLSGGAKKEVLKLEGEKAVQRLMLKVEAKNIRKALRQTVLQIKFDGASKGQVQSPVGDFFGAAPGINPFTSLPFTVKGDGTMISRFVMPFQESMEIVLKNWGDQKVKVSGSMYHKAYNWDSERSMYFQAHWRVDHNLNPNFPYDLPFVAANGQGVYVGTSSLLFNPIEIPTAGGNWWGEGDEKIFVDNHSFPPIYGTGSEDYYNYSWSSSDIFQFPYAGQPVNDGPDNRGFVTNHRWHIVDPIPFKEQLQFFMEMYSHTQRKGFSYARLSYLYARPDLKDDHIPISKEDVRFIEYNKWSPKAQGAASNSVFYQTEELVDGSANTGILKSNLWAEGKLFVWYPESQNDVLKIPFNIDKEGSYKIWMTAAKMSNSGKISMKIDGNEVGFGGDEGIINLHAPHRKLLRNYASDEITLEQGGHTLNIRFEGGESEDRNVVGLDFLWIQKNESDS